jgi:hypothetical protein
LDTLGGTTTRNVRVMIDPARVVPVGPRFRGRSWGANMCVWLGLGS